ncbi:MAG: hypothetical protein ACI4NZ_03360 [Candidatus Enterousia sp.]
MRGYVKTILLTCLLCNPTTMWAVESGDKCDSTQKCDANLYCDSETHKCTSCSESTEGGYPYSDAGSTSKDNCYVNCSSSEIKENNITLGTKTPTNEKAYFSKTCQYTISCGPLAQISGDTCTGKCFKITLVKNLTNTLEDPKYLYEKYANGFYTDKNCEGTKLDPDTTAEPNHDGGWLIPTYTWWQDFIGYSTTREADGIYRFDSKGKPINDTTYTTFDKNTELYGRWNIYNYTIEYYIDDTSNGTQTCHFPRNGATIPDNDPDAKCVAKNPPYERKIIKNKAYTITKWSTGKNGTGTTYYPESKIPYNNSDTIKLYAVWESCSPGYYCGTSEKKECPAGATSDAGSTSETQCYISSTTQFKDEYNAIFTLPIDKIYYHQP